MVGSIGTRASPEPSQQGQTHPAPSNSTIQYLPHHVAEIARIERLLEKGRIGTDLIAMLLSP